MVWITNYAAVNYRQSAQHLNSTWSGHAISVVSNLPHHTMQQLLQSLYRTIAMARLPPVAENTSPYWGREALHNSASGRQSLEDQK
jgi:hypothetical protein